MPPKKFSFEAPLSNVPNAYMADLIFIPAQTLKLLPQKRLRVKGKMNDIPFDLAIQYRKDGNSFFLVSKHLKKKAMMTVGKKVKVEFHLVDPDKVELPEELEAVLEQDDEGKAVWSTFTPGKQRSLAHYVKSVKNVDSRIQRALFLIDKAKKGDYSQSPSKKRSKKNEDD